MASCRRLFCQRRMVSEQSTLSLSSSESATSAISWILEGASAQDSTDHNIGISRPILSSIAASSYDDRRVSSDEKERVRGDKTSSELVNIIAVAGDFSCRMTGLEVGPYYAGS